MAKIPVIHSCGHEVVHNLSGSAKTLDFKVRGLLQNACEACLKKTLRAKHARTIESMNLPELLGSDRQKKWAARIREEIAARVLEMPGGVHAVAKIRQALSQETSAHWWIEHRNAQKAAYKELSSRI